MRDIEVVPSPPACNVLQEMQLAEIQLIVRCRPKAAKRLQAAAWEVHELVALVRKHLEALEAGHATVGIRRKLRAKLARVGGGK